MQITIVGSGYVGRATGLGFRVHGHRVTFIDSNPARVDHLRAEGLNAITPDECKSIGSQLTLISVPTPTVDGCAELHYLDAAVTSIAKRLATHDRYHVVVVRSTVPPRTTRDLVLPILEEVSGKRAGIDFGLAMQPEYLREVWAQQDFARPWFVTIGQLDAKSGKPLTKIYRRFDAPIAHMMLEEAELQKYVHNDFNAVKIAFFNEMRLIATAEGWDATHLFYDLTETCEAIREPAYGMFDDDLHDRSYRPLDVEELLAWADAAGHHTDILSAVIAEKRRAGADATRSPWSVRPGAIDSARFASLVDQAYRATKSAFFSQLRAVANAEGWNATTIFRATAESSEGCWNPLYGLRDFGPFDGSCLPKDTAALLHWGDTNGHDLGVLRAVIRQNHRFESELAARRLAGTTTGRAKSHV